MASLRDRIAAFLAPPAPPNSAPGGANLGGSGSTPAPVLVGEPISKFAIENTRAATVKDCRAMYDEDPRVEKMHRDYAKDLVRQGFVVKTDHQRALDIAEDLQSRLTLNQKLEDWLRLSQRDGDSFLELTIDEALEIAKVTRKPTLQMFRNSNQADEFDDAARAFWMTNGMYYGAEPPRDAIWFAEWQIIHARWNHDEESRYGRPMMKTARKAYKYATEGELDVAVRRKMGAGQLRAHVIENGTLADIEAYKETNAAALGSLAAVTDLFFNKKGALEVHQGDGTLDKIGDVQHHIETMFTASDVPMELIAYGSGLNRDILGEKKDQYEETLNQGREWASVEIIQPLLERQWLLKGILPASVKYSVEWRQTTGLTAAELRDIADASIRLRLLLGEKADAIILGFLVRFVPGLTLNDLKGTLGSGSAGGADPAGSERFAQMLKGLSI